MKTCDNCSNKNWCLITKPGKYYELIISGGRRICPEYSGVEGDKKKMKTLKRVTIRFKSTNKTAEFLTNKDVRLYKLNETCGVLTIISADGSKHVFNWDDILAISLQNVEESDEENYEIVDLGNGLYEKRRK